MAGYIYESMSKHNSEEALAGPDSRQSKRMKTDTSTNTDTNTDTNTNTRTTTQTVSITLTVQTVSTITQSDSSRAGCAADGNKPNEVVQKRKQTSRSKPNKSRSRNVGASAGAGAEAGAGTISNKTDSRVMNMVIKTSVFITFLDYSGLSSMLTVSKVCKNYIYKCFKLTHLAIFQYYMIPNAPSKIHLPGGRIFAGTRYKADDTDVVDDNMDLPDDCVEIAKSEFAEIAAEKSIPATSFALITQRIWHVKNCIYPGCDGDTCRLDGMENAFCTTHRKNRPPPYDGTVAPYTSPMMQPGWLTEEILLRTLGELHQRGMRKRNALVIKQQGVNSKRKNLAEVFLADPKYTDAVKASAVYKEIVAEYKASTTPSDITFVLIKEWKNALQCVIDAIAGSMKVFGVGVPCNMEQLKESTMKHGTKNFRWDKPKIAALPNLTAMVHAFCMKKITEHPADGQRALLADFVATGNLYTMATLSTRQIWFMKKIMVHHDMVSFHLKDRLDALSDDFRHYIVTLLDHRINRFDNIEQFAASIYHVEQYFSLYSKDMDPVTNPLYKLILVQSAVDPTLKIPTWTRGDLEISRLNRNVPAPGEHLSWNLHNSKTGPMNARQYLYHDWDSTGVNILERLASHSPFAEMMGAPTPKNQLFGYAPAPSAASLMASAASVTVIAPPAAGAAPPAAPAAVTLVAPPAAQPAAAQPAAVTLVAPPAAQPAAAQPAAAQPAAAQPAAHPDAIALRDTSPRVLQLPSQFTLEEIERLCTAGPLLAIEGSDVARQMLRPMINVPQLFSSDAVQAYSESGSDSDSGSSSSSASSSSSDSDSESSSGSDSDSDSESESDSGSSSDSDSESSSSSSSSD